MHKKAQGLSLNTIVIASVVLIVLIVLVGVFTGYFGNWTTDFASAGERTCVGDNLEVKSECDFRTEKQVFGKFNPPLPLGEKCCLVLDEPIFKNYLVGSPPTPP